MLDNLNARDGDGEAGRERPRRASENARPLSDREVPLENSPSSDLINLWLDGDAPEPTHLRGDAARQVDLWRRIGEETATRRHMATPVHVQAQIMAALPSTAPMAAEPWYKRPITVTPATAIAAAAGLVALGAALSASVRVR